MTCQHKPNRKKQGTHSGAEPPSSSSQVGQRRKNKQRQGRACEKPPLPPPKPWGPHSRQGTGSAARTGLNPKVSPSQGSCFARARPSRRLLLPRTRPTPIGGLSSFLSKLRQGTNLDISSCYALALLAQGWCGSPDNQVASTDKQSSGLAPHQPRAHIRAAPVAPGTAQGSILLNSDV